MITKKFENRAAGWVKTRWIHKYFYNQEVSMREMNHPPNRGLLTNGASILYNRVREHLRETGRIEGGRRERFSITAVNKAEKREWMKSFGDVKVFHDFIKFYDLTVYGLHASSEDGYHVLKLDLHVKERDEGYYGGMGTIEYETERMREEEKVKRARNEKK